MTKFPPHIQQAVDLIESAVSVFDAGYDILELLYDIRNAAQNAIDADREIRTEAKRLEVEQLRKELGR